MDFTQDSGSCPVGVGVCYRVASLLALPEYTSHKPDGVRQQMNFTTDAPSDFPEFQSSFAHHPRGPTNFDIRVSGSGPSGPGTTCSALYTYYQRVYDNINTFWCYYSGSSINESPGTTDTTPNNSGNISGYSIVYITDQIVCS
jgi:hypothetical protein